MIKLKWWLNNILTLFSHQCVDNWITLICFQSDLLGVYRIISDDLINFEKCILPKIGRIWLTFEFQLSNAMVLEIIRKHFRTFEDISLQDIGIWPRLQFSGQILMHWVWSTIICPKMLRLKCLIDNSAELSRINFSPVNRVALESFKHIFF